MWRAYLNLVSGSDDLFNMGGGSRDLWIYSQLFTSVKWSQGSWSTLELWAVLRDEALTLWDLGHLWGFSIRSELTSGCPVCMGELVTVGGDPTCLVSGTNLDSLFSTICVWGEAQTLGTILYLEEHSKFPTTSWHFQNSWQNWILI